MKETARKNKHMTPEEKIEIEECLCKGMTFKSIAKRIGKSQTTVSREVKARLLVHTNSFVKTEEVCPKLTEHYPEIEVIPADAGCKTPWICKQIFGSVRIPSMPYKRPMTKR